MRLSDKVVIVTGAGSGMGRAIAELFAKEGAKVVASDISEERINEVSTSIKEAGGEALGILANVAKESDVQQLIDRTVQAYGTVDILVNNAGIMDNFIPVGEVTHEHWERVLGVNLNGPMYASRAVLKIMLEKGKGVIINNASVGGLFGARGGAAYVASKHALIGLTKNTAAVYGSKGIRTNAIAPGGVNTAISGTITAPNQLGMEAIGRAGSAPMGEAQEIAYAALFLASDESSFVNGVVLTADGGWTAH
ncbi:NAD(P)-dependent dehydrogenase (short-subunit alcohol dehydrogenase family) [Fontibacillus phaseoli]|uniref:NAD(P)-dependent dehydrogenase (Short-subunit alcohol dehydrogenase family) n=1 Tax=Fontibacillus phaseoli TaxID=1416533 RepID=A0A369BN68_9BACL|nr:glucose 1-dehydrogenase [Fontibacillus phaseoli]RCX22993.1 NAD(P)-dependent dehydrogenase (short-subunit alcohol dehydrogenase family) [Fontibacillus phaseoli]